MKLSVITINFNNKSGLEATLRSVRGQKSRDFEYIVIDGGSSDGSRELIEANADIISHWVSEKDRGIYHAMNKGVARASGHYCLFLNSGDIFHDEEVAERLLREEPDADIIFGRVVNVYPGGKEHLYIPAEEITLLRILQTGLHHAGSLISTELMRRYPYDETLRICSDRKFFMQALVLANCSFRTLPYTVCDFELSGISHTNPQLAKEEYWKIMKELFPPRVVADYRKTNLRIQQTSARLVGSRHKIISFVCGLDDFILKALNLVLGRRSRRR